MSEPENTVKLYKVVTPTWWYEIEESRISNLLVIFEQHDLAWHIVDNIVCVWLEPCDTEKLKLSVLNAFKDADYETDFEDRGWGANKTLVSDVMAELDRREKENTALTEQTNESQSDHTLSPKWKPKKKEKPILRAIRKLREENLPTNVELNRSEIDGKKISATVHKGITNQSKTR